MILPAILALVGQQFSHTHVNVHPVSAQARTEFNYTLSGPQLPARMVTLKGHPILVMENCTAHMCSEHSVVAINAATGEVFAEAVTADGVPIIVHDDLLLHSLIAPVCSGEQWCDLPGGN